MAELLPTKEKINYSFKDINTQCPLCQAQETTQHLLLACPYSKAVWFLTTGLNLDNFKKPKA